MNCEIAHIITESEIEIESKTFIEAWDHPDVTKQSKWREAINKEFKDMNSRNVWTIIKRFKIPPEEVC